MNTVLAEPVAFRHPAPPACLFLRVPARADQACRLRHAVCDFLAAHGWPDDDVSAIALAVGEACNNAVSYSPPDTLVSLQAELCGPHLLHVEIRNPGGGFSRDAACLDLLPDDFAEHGRGFVLMSALMDRVQISIEDGETVVKLSTRR